MILLQHLRQLHADVLGREQDHGGGAAESRRDGRALERIGVHDACSRQLLDMGVAVDTAGQHQLAPRVDLPPRTRQPAADGAIVSPEMATSASNTSLTVATRPPRMRRS